MKSIVAVLTGLAALAAAEQTDKRASATDPTPPTLEQLCVGFTNDDTCQREAHICLTKTGAKRGKDFWEKISTCLEGRHPPPLDQLCAGFTDRDVCQRATQECADEIGENDWVKITTCLEGKPHGFATFDRGVRIKENLLSPKTVAEFYARTGFNDSDCRRHLNDCL